MVLEILFVCQLIFVACQLLRRYHHRSLINVTRSRTGASVRSALERSYMNLIGV